MFLDYYRFCSNLDPNVLSLIPFEIALSFSSLTRPLIRVSQAKGRGSGDKVKEGPRGTISVAIHQKPLRIGLDNYAIKDSRTIAGEIRQYSVTIVRLIAHGRL